MPTANCQLPELPSYRVTSHRVTKLPSNQSSITSHQEDNYQTDEPKHQKRREEDTCLITADYSLIPIDNVRIYILNDLVILCTSVCCDYLWLYSIYLIVQCSLICCVCYILNIRGEIVESCRTYFFRWFWNRIWQDVITFCWLPVDMPHEKDCCSI